MVVIGRRLRISCAGTRKRPRSPASLHPNKNDVPMVTRPPKIMAPWIRSRFRFRLIAAISSGDRFLHLASRGITKRMRCSEQRATGVRFQHRYGRAARHRVNPFWAFSSMLKRHACCNGTVPIHNKKKISTRPSHRLAVCLRKHHANAVRNRAWCDV